MEYQEDDYLMLSGIQHYLFCPRQWALIHIEQQWAENYHTTDGQIIHQRAHNMDVREKRGNTLTVRGMRVHSPQLGISGNCDVVEFHKDEAGIPIFGETGRWIPFPVEYKRGTQKPDACDEAQLCAQAICLEEMLCCDIKKGALYYGKDRHRLEIEFTQELRKTVEQATGEMHGLYEKKHTPKGKSSKKCNACSLKEICMAALPKRMTVENYILQHQTEGDL